MQYRDYSHLDFIQDQYFLDWVQCPTGDKDLFWKEWLKHNPDKKEEVFLAKALVLGITYNKRYELDERSLLALNENIIRYSNKHVREIELKNRSQALLIRYAVAACFLIVPSLAIWLGWQSSRQPLEVPLEMITKSTTAGVKMKLTLPDGSLVVLNSESSITFPVRFSEKERVVHFYGEAFFDVQTDPTRPFVVLAEEFETRVLGTSFNISAYPGDLENKVAVSSGMVQVIGNTGEQVVVSKNEIVILNMQKETIRRELFAEIEETAWKEGILCFRDMPLGEVFTKLERWYGVEIHCDNGVRLTDIYSGQYSGETLDNVLKGISYTSGLVYSLNEKNVNISAGKEVSKN